jgi:hypothetical protein
VKEDSVNKDTAEEAAKKTAGEDRGDCHCFYHGSVEVITPAQTCQKRKGQCSDEIIEGSKKVFPMDKESQVRRNAQQCPKEHQLRQQDTHFEFSRIVSESCSQSDSVLIFQMAEHFIYRLG